MAKAPRKTNRNGIQYHGMEYYPFVLDFDMELDSDLGFPDLEELKKETRPSMDKRMMCEHLHLG